MNSKAFVLELIRATGRVTEALMQGLKPHDISIQQFNVLRILRGQKGIAANLGTVHDLMIHKMSNTTRLIDKLIYKKLVKRNTCKENRRKIELFITPAGLKTLEKVDPIVDQIEAELTHFFSEEQRAKMINMLKQIQTQN